MLTNCFSKKFSTQSKRGRTLIELLIALALSTVLVAAITTIIVVNRSVIRTLSVDAKLEQMGYNALKLITYDLEQAGFIIQPTPNNPFWRWSTIGNMGFSGLGNTIRPVTQETANQNELRISQMIRQASAVLDNDYLTNNASQFISCQGRRIPFTGTATNIVARTTFSISNNHLRCSVDQGTAATNFTTVQADTIIAENVTALTLRYLTPTIDLTEQPNAETTWQWRSRTDMSDALWNQVVAVEICVEVIETSLQGLVGTENTAYTNCNNGQTITAAGVVGRSFRDLVPLKNVIASAFN